MRILGVVLLASLTVACKPAVDPRPPPAEPAPVPSSCGEGQACATDQTCVEYFPIADRPGPPTASCERVCSFDGNDCPADQYCAMESAGAGFVCRPRPSVEIPPDIERVVQLAELWSLVRAYHPWLVLRDVGWGAALREAIPRARQAESNEQLRQVVAQMLAALGDPATVVHGPEPSTPPVTLPITQDEGGSLVINLDRFSPFDRTVTEGIARQIAEAERVIFDLRRWPAVYLPYLEAAFDPWNPQLMAETVSLPVLRYRVVHGFPTQRGRTSGGYYEAFESTLPEQVHGARAQAPPKVAFVLGSSQVLPAIALPLLESGRAVVVATEPLSERAMAPTQRIPFADGAVELRVGETLYRGRPIVLGADEVVADDPIARARTLLERRARPRRRTLEPRPGPSPSSPASAASTPASIPAASAVSTPESLPETLPDVAQRMHVAIDLWSTLDVFHAYTELRPRWDGALAQALTDLRDVQTWDDYARVMMALAARAADGHVGLQGPQYNVLRGIGAPPFQTRVIEGCLVVIAASEQAPVEIGDVIVEIDGVPFSERFDQWAPLVAASTPGAHRHRVGRTTLIGPKDQPMQLVIERDGETRDVVVPRGKPFRPEPPERPYRRVADSTIGVVELAHLTREQVPEMFEALADTKAIIFDMRGYPKGTAWAIAPYLDVHPGPTAAARFVRPRISGRGGLDGGEGVAFVQWLPEADVPHYPGPTVMLIDERTMSQAEHTGLFFEAANGTRFVGSPTSGANGDVTARELPDGTAVWFTGQAVSSAHGRPLQRVGLPPHRHVVPTLAGLRSGRDEVLEEAIDWLVADRLVEPAEPTGGAKGRE